MKVYVCMCPLHVFHVSHVTLLIVTLLIIVIEQHMAVCLSLCLAAEMHRECIYLISCVLLARLNEIIKNILMITLSFNYDPCLLTMVSSLLQQGSDLTTSATALFCSIAKRHESVSAGL